MQFCTQDVQWNDLDYMNKSNDFTYDKEKFKNLPEFVEELHKVSQIVCHNIESMCGLGLSRGLSS